MYLPTARQKSVNLLIFRTLISLLTTIVAATVLTAAHAQQANYNEAPQLAERVNTGDLQLVEERLPTNPRVIEPVERVGTYGGTWRNALIGGSDSFWINRTIGYNQLVVYTTDYEDVIPDIAESVEVNEDATEFTFALREGMKWSDGEPFTANDIMFWYEDVLLNKELTPAIPDWLMVGENPPVVEAQGDSTVVFRFDEPYPLFLDRMAETNGWVVTGFPRHYMEQFHINYNQEGIDGLVEEMGADDWIGLFSLMNDRWTNTERPTLDAWVVTRPYDGSNSRVTFERNPYYWKVDTSGNQLPYLDSVTYDVLEDEEVLLIRTLAGEIDLISRHINTFTNRAVLFDNMESGDYHFFTAEQTGMNVMSLNLNLNHEDAVKREIFQNKDFRIGLSYAINRQEIIDLIYVGQGEPWQMAGQPHGPYYDETLAEQYTEYDIELANNHLDRSGYSERDAQGFRLGPDGKRISFTIETFDEQPWIDTLELIKRHWREVGVEANVRVMDRSLYTTRTEANQHDAAAWFSSGGARNMILEPFFLFPSNVENSKYAVSWARWYQTQGSEGEEPPEKTRQQMDLYDEILRTADEDRQQALMMQLIDIAADQFYAIGIARSVNDYGIVKNTFHNVPEEMAGIPATWPGQTNPEQFFTEVGAQ